MLKLGKPGFRFGVYHLQLCDLDKSANSSHCSNHGFPVCKWDFRTHIAMGDCEVSSFEELKQFLSQRNLNSFMLGSRNMDYIQFHSINILSKDISSSKESMTLCL